MAAPSIIQSGAGFLKGASGAIAAAVAAVTDPLRWLQAFGLMENQHWLIEPWMRQAIFAAIAFAWMFVWYHRQRVAFEERQPPEPDTPLHQACRWIARDSVWAAAQPREQDDHWVSLVDEELMSKVMLGRVELFGKPRNGPMQHVTPAFKSRAQWDSSKLSTVEPPTHMWADGGEVYYTVQLDSEQVKRVWPRKSLWARLRRRSPIERLGGYGYGGQFSKQDAWYYEQKGFGPAPLRSILG